MRFSTKRSSWCWAGHATAFGNSGCRLNKQSQPHKALCAAVGAVGPGQIGLPESQLAS